MSKKPAPKGAKNRSTANREAPAEQAISEVMEMRQHLLTSDPDPTGQLVDFARDAREAFLAHDYRQAWACLEVLAQTLGLEATEMPAWVGTDATRTEKNIPAVANIVDAFILGIAGKLGLHPRDVATLRYGSDGNIICIERYLNDHKVTGTKPIGTRLNEKGVLSVEEGDWLDAGASPTTIPVSANFGEPLVIKDEKDGRTLETCALQFVGLDPLFSNYWMHSPKWRAELLAEIEIRWPGFDPTRVAHQQAADWIWQEDARDQNDFLAPGRRPNYLGAAFPPGRPPIPDDTSFQTSEWLQDAQFAAERIAWIIWDLTTIGTKMSTRTARELCADLPGISEVLGKWGEPIEEWLGPDLRPLPA